MARIMQLVVRGVTIKTTAEHPFWVLGKGWTPAGELTAGDFLTTHTGEWVRVDAVDPTEVWGQVYNLRVADHHTYFVGCDEWGWSVWSHNNSGYGPNAERWADALASRFGGPQNIDFVTPKRFVADGNLFMDQPGKPHVRPIFDDILTDVASSRNREILIPSLIREEIMATTSQIARLESVVHQTQIARIDITKIVGANPSIKSASFGIADLQLLETARIHNLPVVTSNKALVNQIASHPDRKALYGGLTILIPGQNLPSSAYLMNMLNTQP